MHRNYCIGEMFNEYIYGCTATAAVNLHLLPELLCYITYVVWAALLLCLSCSVFNLHVLPELLW